MKSDHLILGSAGTFVLSLGLLFGAKHLGPASGIAVLLGVGLFVVSMIALVAYRVMRLVSFFKR